MKESLTFKLISKLGIHLSSGEYSEISLLGAIKRALSSYVKTILLKYCMYSVFLSPLNFRIIRPFLWRVMGCKVGKKVFIGYSVWADVNNAKLIEIGNNVHITNMCTLLCHQRDLSTYKIGDLSSKLPYVKKMIKIEDDVMIGMNSTILPGITIGKGSIIGANALVSKNIPPRVVASGNPIKIIRKINSVE